MSKNKHFETMLHNQSHFFNVKDAKDFGVNSAILLQHFRFWIIKNKANNRNFIDNRYWTFTSVDGLVKQFPYFSVQNIRTAIKKLTDAGILLKEQYNKSRFDNRCFYSVNEEWNAAEESDEIEANTLVSSNNASLSRSVDSNKIGLLKSTRLRDETNESLYIYKHKDIEKKIEEESLPSSSIAESVVNEWNEKCANNKNTLSKVLSLSAQRKKHIAKTSSALSYDVEDWQRLISIVFESNFLLGQNERSWRCDFDFMIKLDNAIKIAEGKYKTVKSSAVSKTNSTRNRENPYA